MKTCVRCKEHKPATEFYKDARNKDGYRGVCKACVKVQGLTWHEQNKERAAEADRLWYLNNRERHVAGARRRRSSNREEYREQHRQRYAAAPDSQRQRQREWRVRNPERFAARMKLNKALAAGKVARPGSCETCGSGPPEFRLQAHHEDYSQPLDVRWLCPPCHSAADDDRRNREAAA